MLWHHPLVLDGSQLVPLIKRDIYVRLQALVIFGTWNPPSITQATEAVVVCVCVCMMSSRLLLILNGNGVPHDCWLASVVSTLHPVQKECVSV